MIVTAKRIPVPDPMAPMISAMIERAAMQIPPRVAAIGIYFLSYFSRLESLCPWSIISSCLSYLATSLGLDSEISIHYLLKKAQTLSMNMM